MCSRILITIVCFLSLLVMDAWPASGQDQSNPLVIGTVDSLHSSILNEDRKIWVSVPDTTWATFKRNAVLYVLDAESDFSSAQAIVRRFRDLLPDLIIIGITNTNRTRDLTPSRPVSEQGWDSASLASSGGGEKFIQFIQEELIPYVDSKYPTTSYRVLFGHSFGGLFVVNTLVHHNGLFNAYIACEPSLWWDHRRLLKQADEYLATQHFQMKSLFLAITNSVTPHTPLDTSWAKKDTSWRTSQFRSIFHLRDALQKNSKNGLRWSYKYYPDELHGTVSLIALYDGLRFLFDWYYFRDQDRLGQPGYDGVKMIRDHYGEMSRQFGYAVIPKEQDINGLGYLYMSKKQFKVAHDLFKLNIDWFPQSSNVYDSMGDYYLSIGDTDNAIQYFTKALSIQEVPETRQKLNDLQSKKKPKN
ncbi:MAG TPA: alpha/beta hydrolase-fold protein [Puia sp.]|nr:alpha/beta hydrolase-fold protein [Puia sp.]